MKINKGFKFRIYPTKEQLILIQKTFGCNRKVKFHREVPKHHKILRATVSTNIGNYTRLNKKYVRRSNST